MTAVRFDTLAFANKLKAVGFEPKQAETMAQLQEEIIASHDDTLVTKKDLDLAMTGFELKLASMINSQTYKILGAIGIINGLFHWIGK